MRKAPLIALLAAVAAIALAIAFSGGDSREANARPEASAGTPSIEIIAPRNGARQRSHAVVVKVEVRNFELAPRAFGADPQLNQGHIRYSLNRVPDCVDPVKLQNALDSPIGKGRLVGKSFDYPEYSGPNGIVAERIGTAGSYSPGTREAILYRNLHPGFYRAVVTLAQNNGQPTAFHDVTNFQVLPRPGNGPKPCPEGKVPSADAAATR